MPKGFDNRREGHRDGGLSQLGKARILLIVHVFDDVWDSFSDLCQGFVLPKVDLFRLKGLEKALYHGVIKRFGFL